jgi:hypothetical protein
MHFFKVKFKTSKTSKRIFQRVTLARDELDAMLNLQALNKWKYPKECWWIFSSEPLKNGG